ncbi:MAG: 2-amino-4-hydroxy-6-hydroxymethyldihydropteridine diphosphokinase [Verrucomicrobiota bacterium]|jgi:2-amino-4-hydroxy-6-hydroxymethyldihydropteridine diphosphokinase
MSTLAVIALGSNLGDRLTNLRAARDALRSIAVPGTLRQSSIYQTEPVACPDDSPDFFNAVVSFHYSENAAELHAHTRSIEQKLGRARSSINAPRTMDLDLLIFGAHTLQSYELEIPHPRLHLRRFVLEPLAEIHPDLPLPPHGNSIATLLSLLNSAEPALQRVTSEW